MMSNYKVAQCLEWYTILPVVNHPQESPVFFLQGNECFFQFMCEKFGGTWYYELYLEIKNQHTELKQCSIRYQVGFKKEKTLSLEEKVFKISNHCEIWCTKVSEFNSKLPSDYLDGNCIKLVFYFDDHVDPLFKINKIAGDKSIQTPWYMDAGTSRESLSKDLLELRNKELNHDMEIKCGELSIKAHKTVLCARSDVLSAMLQSDMQEGRTSVVKIKDMNASDFQEFVEYLYTDTMPELTFDKAKALYEAGDKYHIKSLFLRCSEYFQDSLTLENFFQYFVLADAHSDQKLKDKIMAYILEEEVYLNDEHWFLFYENYPKVALEVYKLSYKKNKKQKVQ